MARDNNQFDTTFNPNIAALAMPRENEFSAIGKSISDFGKVLQDSQDGELRREAAKTSIAESQQRQDFASKLFPKQMEESDLKIAGQTTANKASELQYKTADELWKDKKNTDYLQSYIKANGLTADDHKAMLDNHTKEPDTFKYKDPLSGEEYQIMPHHITSAFDVINKQNLSIEEQKAKIASEKAGTEQKKSAAYANYQQAKLEKEKLDFAKKTAETKEYGGYARPTADEYKRYDSNMDALRKINAFLANGDNFAKAGGLFNAPVGKMISGTTVEGSSGAAYGDLQNIARSVSAGNKAGTGSAAEIKSVYDDLSAGGALSYSGEKIKNNLVKTRQELINRIQGEYANVSIYDTGRKAAFDDIINPPKPTKTEKKQETVVMDSSLVDARSALNNPKKNISEGSKGSVIDRLKKYDN